jgi:hypothetical protein
MQNNRYQARNSRMRDRDRDNLKKNTRTDRGFFRYVDGKLERAEYSRKQTKNGMMRVFDAKTQNGKHWMVEIKIDRPDGTFHVHRKNLSGAQINKFMQLSDSSINSATEATLENKMKARYKNYNGRPNAEQLQALHSVKELEALAHELGLTISHQGKSLTKPQLARKIAKFIETGKMTEFEKNRTKSALKKKTTKAKTKAKTKSKTKIRTKARTRTKTNGNSLIEDLQSL